MPAAPDLRTVLGDLLADTKTLVAQQVALARAEAGEELGKVGGAAAAVAAGGGLAAVGGLLAGLAAARGLSRATGLPLGWGYALAAAGLGAASVGLLRAGRDRLAALRPFPQTTAAFGDNVEWLTARLTAARA